MAEARAACLNGCSRCGSDGSKQIGLVVARFELSGWCSHFFAAVLASVAASQKMKEQGSLQPRRIFQSDLRGRKQLGALHSSWQVAQPRSHAPSRSLFRAVRFDQTNPLSITVLQRILGAAVTCNVFRLHRAFLDSLSLSLPLSPPSGSASPPVRQLTCFGAELAHRISIK